MASQLSPEDLYLLPLATLTQYVLRMYGWKYEQDGETFF
jgi:hypothetical protein